MQRAKTLLEERIPMIMGSDALAGLPTWHRPADLIRQVRFLQAPRPDYPFMTELSIDGQRIALDTVRIEMPPLAISASGIRALVSPSEASGEALRYLLPEAVRCFILQNGLYRKNRSG